MQVIQLTIIIYPRLNFYLLFLLVFLYLLLVEFPITNNDYVNYANKIIKWIKD